MNELRLNAHPRAPHAWLLGLVLCGLGAGWSVGPAVADDRGDRVAAGDIHQPKIPGQLDWHPSAALTSAVGGSSLRTAARPVARADPFQDNQHYRLVAHSTASRLHAWATRLLGALDAIRGGHDDDRVREVEATQPHRAEGLMLGLQPPARITLPKTVDGSFSLWGGPPRPGLTLQHQYELSYPVTLAPESSLSFSLGLMTFAGEAPPEKLLSLKLQSKF